jgi:hypothetical protein
MYRKAAGFFIRPPETRMATTEDVRRAVEPAAALDGSTPGRDNPRIS